MAPIDVPAEAPASAKARSIRDGWEKAPRVLPPGGVGARPGLPGRAG